MTLALVILGVTGEIPQPQFDLGEYRRPELQPRQAGEQRALRSTRSHLPPAFWSAPTDCASNAETRASMSSISMAFHPSKQRFGSNPGCAGRLLHIALGEQRGDGFLLFASET